MRPNKTLRTIGSIFIAIVFSLSVFHSGASAQSTAFSFQGLLNDGPSEANGNYDFEFRLYDALSGGSEIGSVNARSAVTVEDGAFAVTLDFGAGFPGAERFLEIRVRPAGGASFTTLDPRQKVDSSPYAMQSLNAASAANAQNAVNAENALSADTAINAQNAVNAANATTAANALSLGGVAADQFVVTTDPRLSDSRQPAPGSGSYIQNTTDAQTAANFNISGTGKADSFNVESDYRVKGHIILRAIGVGPAPPTSIYVGVNSGSSSTNTNNSFFGANTGPVNNASHNSFFGSSAGQSNTGFPPSALGNPGGNNSFFGSWSGANNTTGFENTFVGAFSGRFTTTGYNNSFFGSEAGRSNTEGTSNVFLGKYAGYDNTIGDSNTFVGTYAGFFNQAGSGNTLLGSGADVLVGPLANATAVGYRSLVTKSNSLVLGSINGVNSATADTNVGIGTTAPNHRLHIAVNSGHITFGGFGCDSGFTGIAFGNASANCLSYSLKGNGTDTMLNVPSGGSILFRVGNITRASINSSGVLSGNGSGLTNLNASNLSVGTLGVARGGTGLTSPGASGNFLRSNGTSWSSSGLIASDLPPGSNSYIQNRTTVQASTNFNVGGIGVANIFNAVSHYRIADTLMFAANGRWVDSDFGTPLSNIFVGYQAGIRTVPDSDTGSQVGKFNLIFGTFAGWLNVSGQHNTFLGTHSGFSNTNGNYNTFLGTWAGRENQGGSTNTAIGSFATFGGGALVNATALGSRSQSNCNNCMVLGSISGVNGATSGTNVGIGTSTPTDTLHVNGRIRVASLGSANTTTVLCRNTAQQIATCNSSSRRYKFNIQDFGSGLELIRRLRPVAYNWIAGGARDVGLVAEEVAVAEPLLATYNDNGEVEGVKYDRVGVVVINAVTEQQAMIDDQRKTIAAQQDRIEKLEQQAKIMQEALCRLTADSGICGMK